MDEHANKELGVLASATAAIEATRTEITDVKIEISDEACHGKVRLAIPLNDVNHLEDTRIAVEQTRVVEEALQIDVDIQIDIPGTAPPDRSQFADQQTDANTSISSNRETGGENVNRQRTQSSGDAEREDTPGAVNKKTTRPTPTPNDPATNVFGGECDANFTTGDQTDETDPTKNEVRDRKADEKQDRTRYRDPEKLAAVYDEDATFEEMKAELGVDVTAQTVRKYMIKYGIHDPKPRPDRMLESIRASELDLKNSDENEQPNRAEDSDGSDIHEN